MKNISNIKNFKPVWLVGNINELERDYGKFKYRFRLVGIPPNQAIQLVDIDPNSSIAELKKSVIRLYKLNPILAIQFIYKGKVLPDYLKCSIIVRVHTKREVITVMGIMGGG